MLHAFKPLGSLLTCPPPAQSKTRVLSFPHIRFGAEPDHTSPERENNNMDLHARLKQAVEAARRAGDILISHFRNPALLKVSMKAGQEVVTNADQEADQAIRDTLQSQFPKDDYLTEETFDPKQTINLKSAWIIDPLDATRNFANRIPHFAVSIAYVREGKPVVGVVYDPVGQEMFTAVSGEPVKVNDHPVQVNPAETPDKTILSLCNPLPEKFAKTKATHRRLGCAALDMAYVASGRLGAACERNLKVWDIAAGIPMVEGAGGKVTDFEGKPLDLNQKLKVNYLATNGHLHPAMVDLLADPEKEAK